MTQAHSKKRNRVILEEEPHLDRGNRESLPVDNQAGLPQSCEVENDLFSDTSDYSVQVVDDAISKQSITPQRVTLEHDESTSEQQSFPTRRRQPRQREKGDSAQQGRRRSRKVKEQHQENDEEKAWGDLFLADTTSEFNTLDSSDFDHEHVEDANVTHDNDQQDDQRPRVKAWKHLINHVVMPWGEGAQKKKARRVYHDDSSTAAPASVPASNSSSVDPSVTQGTVEDSSLFKTSSSVDNIFKDMSSLNLSTHIQCGSEPTVNQEDVDVLTADESVSDDEDLDSALAELHSVFNKEYTSRRKEQLEVLEESQKIRQKMISEHEKYRHRHFLLAILRHLCPQYLLWTQRHSLEDDVPDIPIQLQKVKGAALGSTGGVPQHGALPLIALPLRCQVDPLRPQKKVSVEIQKKLAAELQTQWCNKSLASRKWCLMEGLLHASTPAKTLRDRLFQEVECRWLGVDGTAAEWLDKSHAKQRLEKEFPHDMKRLEELIEPSPESMVEIEELLNRLKKFRRWRVKDKEKRNTRATSCETSSQVPPENTIVSPSGVSGATLSQISNGSSIDIVSASPVGIPSRHSIDVLEERCSSPYISNSDSPVLLPNNISSVPLDESSSMQKSRMEVSSTKEQYPIRLPVNTEDCHIQGQPPIYIQRGVRRNSCSSRLVKNVSTHSLEFSATTNVSLQRTLDPHQKTVNDFFPKISVPHKSVSTSARSPPIVDGLGSVGLPKVSGEDVRPYTEVNHKGASPRALNSEKRIESCSMTTAKPSCNAKDVSEYYGRCGGKSRCHPEDVCEFYGISNANCMFDVTGDEEKPKSKRTCDRLKSRSRLSRASCVIEKNKDLGVEAGGSVQNASYKNDVSDAPVSDLFSHKNRLSGLSVEQGSKNDCTGRRLKKDKVLDLPKQREKKSQFVDDIADVGESDIEDEEFVSSETKPRSRCPGEDEENHIEDEEDEEDDGVDDQDIEFLKDLVSDATEAPSQFEADAQQFLHEQLEEDQEKLYEKLFTLEGLRRTREERESTGPKLTQRQLQRQKDKVSHEDDFEKEELLLEALVEEMRWKKRHGRGRRRRPSDDDSVSSMHSVNSSDARTQIQEEGTLGLPVSAASTNSVLVSPHNTFDSSFFNVLPASIPLSSSIERKCVQLNHPAFYCVAPEKDPFLASVFADVDTPSSPVAQHTCSVSGFPPKFKRRVSYEADSSHVTSLSSLLSINSCSYLTETYTSKASPDCLMEHTTSFKEQLYGSLANQLT